MISIRRMTLEDVPQVAGMEKMIFTDPWSENVYRQTLKLDEVIYLVAVDDEAMHETDEKSDGLNSTRYDKIVGVCGVRNIVGDGEITNVMVLPEYRNRHIAADMLKELLGQGSKMGVSDFTLEVRASNAPAISLYEKLGFVSEGVRKNFYDHPKEDAMIMWKRNSN